MNEYNFALHLKLSCIQTDPSIYEDRLFEAGCDDALLGIGQQGYLGLNFIRTANNGVEAITTAIEDIKTVIPDCELYYISPDVVGMTEIATFMQCSVENILKLKNARSDIFPFPINSDSKFLNWHLAEVLKWYQKQGNNVDLALLEVAEFAMQFNLEKQNQNINSDPDLKLKARALVS